MMPEVEFEWKIPKWSNASNGTGPDLFPGLRGRRGIVLRRTGSERALRRLHLALERFPRAG